MNTIQTANVAIPVADSMGGAIKPSAHQLLFENLQGNILKGHGRENAWHIFLHFNATDQNDIDSIKAWMKMLNITTAWEQHSDSDKYKEIRDTEPKLRTDRQNQMLKYLSTKVVSFFFLSQSGYNALEVDTTFLTDSSFKNGMKKQAGLHDPEQADWDFSTNDENDSIDAMLLIACDNYGSLQTQKQQILNALPGGITLVHAQFGETLRDKNNIGLEHFGYADGISQPLMLLDDERKIGKLWDDEADPHEMVLVKDESTTADKAYGSYFVFRKLDQNVKAFKEAEKELGLGEIGGAYVVGRFEDGTPVAKYGEDLKITEESKLENDFDYKNDPSGNKCPYHAHIRMTNPRDVQPATKPIRIVRRGIPYDEAGRGGNLDWHPEGKVGLLFMCYQKSIKDQFEVLQIKWSNEGNISIPLLDPGRKVAIDGIIGQGESNLLKQEYPVGWNSAYKKSRFNLKHFVTMKGGEYFFAPSIKFIEGLVAPTALQSVVAKKNNKKADRSVKL